MVIEKGEIDLMRYGTLWQKVETLERRLDKMELQIDQLLALANKGKGGLWFGVTIASALTAAVGMIFNHWKGI